MVEEKKVRLMTKLAIYEKKQNHKDISVSRFYKTDYVRYNVLKSIVAATIAYWLIVGIYIYLKFEDILAKLNEVDYFDLMYKVLGTYAVVCVVYLVFTSAVYYVKYEFARPGLTEYNSNLRDLIEELGGPSHRRKPVKGKVVSKHQAAVALETEEGLEQSPYTTRDRDGRVSRVAMVMQKQAEADRLREQQIVANVKERNERIANQNRERLLEQQKKEMQQRAVRERREQLEREQLDRLRAENEAAMQRQDYQYGNNGDSEGSDL